MKTKYYLKQFTAAMCGLSLLLLPACSNEEMPGENTSVALKPGEISLQCMSAGMGRYKAASRAGDDKTPAEQKINNVHVFLFNENGEYLKPDGGDADQAYTYSESTNVVLQSGMLDSGEAGNATVYVLANMPKDMFTDADGDTHPDEVTNLSDLENLIFTLPAFTANLPETGLPMALKQEDVDLRTQENGLGRVVTLNLKSLMARIDLTFNVDPLEESDNGMNPSLHFDEVRVFNFPSGGKLKPQLSLVTNKTDSVTDVPEGVELKNAVVETDFTGKIIRKNETQELTLYMFEHGRESRSLGDKGLENYFPHSKYPANIEEHEKQRYKKVLAQRDAAYIELEGIYTNHNDFKYKVTYRFFPGENPNYNFTITGNCQYKNNIIVTGITANDENNDEREALLDTRVDVDTEINPYFIEMLRERHHDAHFNVTPMDIYMYEQGTVKVEIVDPDAHPWIRLEPKANTIGNDACIQDPNGNEKYAVSRGDGKRKYFTTDLVTNTLRNNTTYTVTCAADLQDQIYEERIYLYLDENVPTVSQAERGTNVPAREARLKVTYHNPATGYTHEREIPIIQAGMIAVYFDKFGQGGGYDEGRDNYYFYLEEYEEYLTHFDGKDDYTDTYEGMEWGLTGLSSGLGVKNGKFSQFMSWGWYNTKEIMDAYKRTSDWDGEMTLNDVPIGAAEYCYNKNKRNANGSVSEVEWYLPTISETEYALEKGYGRYKVFQDQWYWSSNPGAVPNREGGGDDGEDPDYARATRIYYDPDHKEADRDGWVHYQSNPDWPYKDYPDLKPEQKKHEGGHAKRIEKFRVRAMYIPEGAKPSDVRH